MSTAGVPVTDTHTSFAASLKRFGLNPTSFAQTILDGKGEGPIHLDSSGGPSAQEPQILTTNDLDELKQWLGLPNDVAAKVAQSFSSPFNFAPQALTDKHDETERLMLAAHDYVFHGGASASSGAMDPGLKRAIEQTFAPLKCAVFAGDTVIVKPGQPLIVTGSVPVSLNYREMDIYAGGQVLIYAPGSMTIQVLKRFS